MRSKWICAVAVGVLGAAGYAGNVLATPASGLKTTILAKSQFDGIDINSHTIPAHWRAKLKTDGLSDVYVVDNTLAPHGTTGWHSHPGPSLILVVAGTVTNYMGDDPTCTGHAYPKGSGFVDPGGTDVHMLRNDTDAAAETIAVQLLPTGSDRKIEAADPGNCRF
ncbi:MAG: hypothetical protein QOE28_2857 [Solirubrobacteraceae bacterium]|nr:hypothetical protein [Solirubrobacteraceae bacterium]